MADQPFTLPSDALTGPQNITTTNTSVPWGPFQQPLINYSQILQNATFPGGQQVPYMYPNQNVAVFDPLQIFSQIIGGSQALQNAPLSSAADYGALLNLGGTNLYPESNPYLADTYNQAAQGVSDQYRYATAPSTQAQFAHAGNFGGSAMNQTRQMQQYTLGQNLDNLATNIYGGNYQTERENQLKQQALLPVLQQFGSTIPQTLNQIGTQRQALTQEGMGSQYQNQMQRAQYLYNMLGVLGSGLQGVGNIGGSQTSTQPNPNFINPLAALLSVEQSTQGGGGGGLSNILPLLALGGLT